jgi:succinate dehydrogenase / fumarate reductase cytochrome b subunit
MAVKKEGPRNIGVFDLTRYRFPMTAIASILHRVSGVLLFLLIPVLLWVLEQSLVSEERFHHLLNVLHTPTWRFVMWVGLSAFLYHMIAGVKHLFMDFGYFENLRGGAMASRFVIGISVIGMIALGVSLW